MSYDIHLVDKHGDIIDLPCEMLPRSGTFAAEMDPVTGVFRQRPIREAHINITYNYSRYYHEAVKGTPWGLDPETGESRGIRAVYGMTPVESVPVISDMIRRIVERYAPNGEYAESKREKTHVFDENDRELNLGDLFARGLDPTDLRSVTETYTLSEGDVSDYWEATAANAVLPLQDMLAMALASIGQDCVWDGD